MKDPTFEATVQNAWNTQVQGMNIFVVARKKRKAVKEALKLWNRKTYGNINRDVNSLRFELETIHNQIQSDPLNGVLADREKEVSEYYEDLMTRKTDLGRSLE